MDRDREIVVHQTDQGKISLVLKTGDEVVDEWLLSKELARQLRTVLEKVISGRGSRGTAKAVSFGFHQGPEENFPNTGCRPSSNGRSGRYEE